MICNDLPILQVAMLHSYVKSIDGKLNVFMCSTCMIFFLCDDSIMHSALMVAVFEMINPIPQF